MEEGTKPFALIYHIYYILLGTQLNPSAINHKEPSSKTMLIQCSTPNAKVIYIYNEKPLYILEMYGLKKV